jgi:hypothetical protein
VGANAIWPFCTLPRAAVTDLHLASGLIATLVLLSAIILFAALCIVGIIAILVVTAVGIESTRAIGLPVRTRIEVCLRMRVILLRALGVVNFRSEVA